MFANTCTACGKHSLIFPSQITGIANTDHGVELSYVCWCGVDQVWRAHEPAKATAAA